MSRDVASLATGAVGGVTAGNKSHFTVHKLSDLVEAKNDSTF